MQTPSWFSCRPINKVIGHWPGLTGTSDRTRIKKSVSTTTVVSNAPDRFHIEYHTGLVEETIMLAIEGHPREREFRRSRDRIYEITDHEKREKEFQEFHSQWFLRLDLGRPLTAALSEQSSLTQCARCCRLIAARSRQEEGADLHGTKGAGPEAKSDPRAVVVRLCAGSFLNPQSLLNRLRHEFMHVADMLAPWFGYQPQLPSSEAGPAYDNLLRERYRVLWDAWIDGRILRRGWTPEMPREKRLAEFAAAFPMPGEETEACFCFWFHFAFHTHAEMVRFALNPTSGEHAGLKSALGGRCPLCRFPSYEFLENSATLPFETLQEISREFPEWRPEQGLCRQCADLYEARHLSRLALATLPKG